MGDQTTNSATDPSSPFYLHHSDYPGLMLVSKPLTGDNYGTWCRSMSIALSAKNKLGFVNGSVEKPSEKKTTELALWQRCNDMVLSWILNTLSSDLSTSVAYLLSAKEEWDDLDERFSQQNVCRLFELQRDLARINQNQQPVNVYFTKIKSLWDEIDACRTITPCSCGAAKSNGEAAETTKVLQVLMGLDDSYAAIRGQILLNQPLPSIRKIYSMLIQEEKQRVLTTGHNLIEQPAAMAVKFNRDGFKGRQGERKPLHCSHCDRDHHTVDTCWKIHGYPPGHRLHGKTENSNVEKRKNNNNINKSGRSSVNNIQTSSSNGGPNLTAEQFEQLYTMMSQKMGLMDSKPSANHAAGPGDEDDDWLGATT